MILSFSRHSLDEYSNIKFNKNLFSGSRVIPCERMDGQAEYKQTDGRDELIVAFRNFQNKPKNCYIILVLVVITLILKFH